MKKIVVIGGVAAGLKSAAKVRRGNPDAEITVVEKGELISYGACGMPYFVSGDISDIKQIMMTSAGAMRNQPFFKNVKNIDVLIKTEATHIDRENKQVQVKDLSTGEERMLGYDKLVLATGARPVKPILPGMELANIYQMWHPNDATVIRRGLEKQEFKQAVIIGAGLIGIEMAEAFKQWDVEVTIVEMKDQLCPAFLDKDIAASVAKYARDKGITVVTGEKVEQFKGEGKVSEVVTNKQTIPADVVIVAVGVRPNVELASQAGLAIGETGAIMVNEHMETSDPNIYAGGDCVENTNIISGKKVFAPMGSTANKHGRVIGENICGSSVKFRGVLNTVVVKLLDLNIGKTGLTEQDAKALGYEYITAVVPGHDRPHYMPDAKFITIKLIVDIPSRKLLGAQAFGEGEVAKRIDIIAAALTFGGTVDDLFDIDLAYAPPYSPPIDNVAVAANVVMNKLTGSLQGISVLDAKEKASSDEAVFLDVRSADELKQIGLSGCNCLKHIPLGALRTRIDELDKNSEIIAFCKISLRGYEAALILQGEGFTNVKVMEGGIIAWPFACESGGGKK